MKYVLFILNLSDNNAIDRLKQCIQQHKQRKQEDGHTQCLRSAYGKIITVDKDFKFAKVSGNVWLPLESIRGDQLKAEDEHYVSELSHQSTDEKMCLSQCLLTVSESTPYAGVSIQVLMLNPKLEITSETEISCLRLYGALKKWSCWHNAEIVIVTDDHDETEGYLKELVDFTGASVTADISTVDHSLPVWRGNTAVSKNLDSPGRVFHGFQLECDPTSEDAFYRRLESLYCARRKRSDTARNPMMGRVLEVLDQVDSRTIPAFMLTSHTLSLSVWNKSETSETLMQIFHELDQMAVIARLAVYDPETVTDCSKKLSAQSWRDRLIANIAYSDEMEEELLVPVSFMHVAILGDGRHPGRVSVVVLRDWEEVTAPILAMESRVPAVHDLGDSEVKVDMLLDDLPKMSGELLDEMTQSLEKLQTTALQDWIDKMEAGGQDAVMSSETLLKFLGKVQNGFLAQLLQDGVFNADGWKSENDSKLPTLESDLSSDPANWPERLALQHQDSQKREMRRFQSAESMKSSCHSDAGMCTTIEVKDFLKLFNPEGDSSMGKLSPIRHSKRKLSKLSSRGETVLQWPDCKDTMFHGIHYYKDRVSELDEERSWAMREKFVKQETCSSFTTKHLITKTRPVTRRTGSTGRNLMSPNRKSPRNRLFVTESSQQKISTHHSGLKSPRAKCRRRPAASQPLRRSPRKQASLRRLNSDSNMLPPPPQRKGDNRSQDDFSLSDSNRTESDIGATEDALKKQSRSERHKKKLENIVRRVLVAHRVKEEDDMFKLCFSKLFQVSKFFVKALPNSRNLGQEMKKIAEGQVTQVVDLMSRRLEMKSKK